jgi:serine/threonine protein kinase
MIEGIEEIHKTGKIHRDIKPSNIRVHEGRIYIIDFGKNLSFIDANKKFCLEWK